MEAYEEAVAAIAHELRQSPAGVHEEWLHRGLAASGHDPLMVTLALSSLTAGGTVVVRNGYVYLGTVDRSLPPPE